MLTKVVQSGKSFYSMIELAKILKEPPTMVSEKAIKANNLQNLKDYILRLGVTDYYFTINAMYKAVKPYSKKVEGMLAKRAIQESDDEEPKTKKDEKEKNELVKDYSRRLTNASAYRITRHAEKRIFQRFGVQAGKKQEAWFKALAPRLGYVGTQFGSTQEIWGNDEATVITNPEDKNIITVLAPDMEVLVSHSEYTDIDDTFNKMIHSMELKENRSYWDDLAVALRQLGETAISAADNIDTTRNAKSERGLELMNGIAESAVSQYKQLVYETETVIDEHTERMKYIESKR